MSDSISRRTVKVLRDSVARRIAAGEIIERPASVVRELLDNSIDADAGEISVYVDGGGIERIRVIDDGLGMTEEDLRLCWLPHATSKIETEEDLQRVRSLGFRGEALAGIATASRAEITSRPREGDESAYRLVVHGGELRSLEPTAGKAGTVVEAADLFYAIPARRKFLKRESAETSACRQVFLEKALAFPERAFKFHTRGELRLFLPPGTLIERIAAAYPKGLDARALHLLKGTGEGFSLEVVAAPPEFSFRDRRYLQIFVNRRRIWEYALVQGVEYSFGDYIPGGRFPACFVYIDIDPALVDFNIHPAKREAKIRNLPEIRGRLTEALGNYLRGVARKRALSPDGDFSPTGLPGLDFPGDHRPDSRRPSPGLADAIPPTGIPGRIPGHRSRPFFSPPGGGPAPGSQDLHIHEIPAADFSPEDPKPGTGSGPMAETGAGEKTPGGGTTGEAFIYRGQAFGLFLIAERGDQLFLVDQHAAHERIIYDALAADRVPQRLLFPAEFESEEDNTEVVRRNAVEVLPLGIHVEERGPRLWAITALPAVYRGGEEEIIQTLGSFHGAAGALKKELFANLACKKAVKDGSPVDPATAAEIIRQVLPLENPRCPHGRPLWFEVSREELFKHVGRIV